MITFSRFLPLFKKNLVSDGQIVKPLNIKAYYKNIQS